MAADTFFRLFFAVLIIAVLGIRSYGHAKAGSFSNRSRSRYDEGRVTRLMRPLPVLLGMGSILYLVAPQLMAWSTLDLPTWLRLMSVPLGLIATVGMIWVHMTLRENFSGKLEIRDDHTLVTTGPYRWVRHPMYTAVIILFIAVFLLTANWFIGLVGIVMNVAVIVTRTPKEEAMLVETFGEPYVEYMERTPRYLPRVFN
jgi:protein-S-isoprenylcysteine O-methyltransferase Ste14